MIHIVLEIWWSKLSSGMDDAIDRLTRKTTILMMIFGKAYNINHIQLNNRIK